MPKPSGMVMPGAWNFKGASIKLIPAIRPAQNIELKIAMIFFILISKYIYK